MQPDESQYLSNGLGNLLARGVVRHRWLIVIGWVLLAVIAKTLSPDWKSIAYDGDFEYLPATMRSVAGDHLLDAAFPTQRSRSQIVLVVSRNGEPLDKSDDVVSMDLLRHLYYRIAEVMLWKASRSDSLAPDSIRLRSHAKEFLDEAIRLDQLYFDGLTDLDRVSSVPAEQLRLTKAFWDRGNLLQQLGEDDLAASDTQTALVLSPTIATDSLDFDERGLAPWESLVDLHSWKDSLIGSQMEKPEARLAILLSNVELAATSNIDFLKVVDDLKDSVLDRNSALVRPGLEILATGSAAIGGETLTAARDAIRYTELLTVLMILAILGLVYRAPLLVFIPVFSIAIAVMVSSGLVAWLTIASKALDLSWFDFRVFTTSRIFVVVILFGSGTDFCLFLISRLREEALQWPWEQACIRSLSGVSGALVGSALTTILGLGMLVIAQFGKFHYTGPIIALCLAIGLLVCLTFTPALLSLIGPRAFWPSTMGTNPTLISARLGNREGLQPTGLWGLIALKLTRYPGIALLIGLGLLAPPALFGYRNEDDVTYDISSQLDDLAESKRGLRVLDRYFDMGSVNPTTLLITLPAAVAEEKLRENTKQLAQELYTQTGVLSVRSADDPLGDFPPDRPMSLLSSDAWKRRALQTHRIAQNYFFSESPPYLNRLVRLDIVIEGDPFGIEAAEKVKLLDEWVLAKTKTDDSAWSGAQTLLTGTTPSIIDLRSVTLSDSRRIKVAVVVAVFLALWLVIRRVSLCSYLIATVLLSYYATLGLTIAFYRYAYGDDYVGLDWKLPLFLFVILVAVGQDYNVYLVTRIIEEQRERGWLSALRRAVARTGGIITACGLVMAATFFSMTASAWLPALNHFIGIGSEEHVTSLRGIVELGFALGLGVLIDTFYVRTILVPSFVAVLDRVRNGPRLPTLPDDSDNELAVAGHPR